MLAGNFLELNDDKAELVVLGNPKRLSKVNDFELSVGNVRVKASAWARNLGVYYDSLRSFT